MARPIVFWGALGHARVLREVCDHQGYDVIALFDNNPEVASPFDGVPIFYGPEGFLRWRSTVDSKDVYCLVTIGGARGRDRIALQRFMSEHGVLPVVAVHPTAFVARDAVIGAGSHVLAQTAVCSASVVGDACIINTKASVDHECRLGDGVHLAPGATLAGCVSIGDGTFIGTAAAVLPRIRIGKNSIIGAGAVVTRDIPDNVVAYGNPARIVRDNPPVG